MAATDNGWGGGPPTVLRMILGRQLEELRSRAGVSFEQAGEVIGVSHSTIRRMEQAKVARLRLSDVEKLLRTYGITETAEIETFLELAREANKHGWWHTYRDVMPDWFGAYLTLEQAAVHIRAYEAQFIPGLLQTEEYAHALLTAGDPQASAEDIDRRVALRLTRQQILTRTQPPLLWAVMDETVLHWPVGGPKVMRAQIDHLLEIGELPNVRLQMMPFANGPHPATRAGAFQLFRFEAAELPDVVYLGGLIGSTYLDKQDEVAAYREAMDRLAAQAAQEKKTKALLGALRKEL
ncbi:helix-turn-helix domain-containing protein [Streptomyces sp. CBMA29]|uniref:helix-turn-helix domain-containing protein n=1 Tax=Streptomyces sp. CBMA29 TaxID=1896314 RepID=UPI0016618E8C|nr:helix-turn-helix transcriptional regulator [Streptomyces sp. CBMA29]MBD0734234.1 transcriptional regulator [Streptomyces sp. CBMA29]